MDKIDPRDLAAAMAMLCNTETVADVMNALLSCEADERLSDNEANAGDQLLEHLMDVCPEAVSIAQA